MSAMIAAAMARAHPGVRSQCSDRGATAVEYAIMVSLIAAVIIASVTVFGVQVSDLFQSAADAFASF